MIRSRETDGKEFTTVEYEQLPRTQQTNLQDPNLLWLRAMPLWDPLRKQTTWKRAYGRAEPKHWQSLFALRTLMTKGEKISCLLRTSARIWIVYWVRSALECLSLSERWWVIRLLILKNCDCEKNESRTEGCLLSDDWWPYLHQPNRPQSLRTSSCTARWRPMELLSFSSLVVDDRWRWPIEE
jgi:hypothetical protein